MRARLDGKYLLVNREYERLFGVRRENIILCDRQGVVRADRDAKDMDAYKSRFATQLPLRDITDANRDAVRALKLDLNNPQAADVEFLKDSQGRPTGHMRGKGVTRLFNAVIPRTFSRERRLQQTKDALTEIRKYGVTNVSDMSDDVQLDIYRELHRTGDLTVRIHFRPGLDRWKELSKSGIRVGSGDEWIRLGALKGHIDGIMGTHGALFSQNGRWHYQDMGSSNGTFVGGAGDDSFSFDAGSTR